MKVTELMDAEAFKPIELKIVLEDVVDLKYLWLVANIGYLHLKKAYSDDEKSLRRLETISTTLDATNKYDLWHILDKHMERLGLK